MQKNLLLGNGINIQLSIEKINNEEIAKRFANNLDIYNPIFELLFGINVSNHKINDNISNLDYIGIERLANILYEYLEKNTKKIKSINFEIRLIDTIICLAITSIFCDCNTLLGNNYKNTDMIHINEYQNIYSPNYVEFWDVNNICTYLHGHIDLKSIKSNKKPIFFYSKDRYKGLEEYRIEINKLSNRFNVIELYTGDIVFSPEFHSKRMLIALGKYPSNLLFPANDLPTAIKIKKLYVELEVVKNIEIFGVSPYGDNDLLDILNKMDMVTVYVYDKEKNKQTEKWNKSLTCKHIIKDSREI